MFNRTLLFKKKIYPDFYSQQFNCIKLQIKKNVSSVNINKANVCH